MGFGGILVTERGLIEDVMSKEFDFVVVGGGSTGAVIAARLSEDPNCSVALIEAGDRPPEHELMPIACASLQLDPNTDWMYTADPGKAGLGLHGRLMPVPRGKMLGGSSGMNYMAYVRGHPSDFDGWAAGGATGWSYEEVLPYFCKSENFAPTIEIPVDQEAHGKDGPLDVSVRSPVLSGARDFVTAAEASGIPGGDYNGRDRGGPSGVSSLFQTTTKKGKRASTYHAFLEGDAEKRPNLTIITCALVTRVILNRNGEAVSATGIEYRDTNGNLHALNADKEVILSAGAIGSSHLLMLSGIGPRQELESVGVNCLVNLSGVGKHLKDHLYCALFFPAPSIGVSLSEVGKSMGPEALRAPEGPLPLDPTDYVQLNNEQAALKLEAEHHLEEWKQKGVGLASSSLYDAVAFYSTKLGDHNSHDAQIAFFACGGAEDEYNKNERIDTSRYFSDAGESLAADRENILLLANPVLPRSEGEITLASANPVDSPEIRMNYYCDPYDLKVMVAVMRQTFEIARNWPGPHKLGPLNVPPHLAQEHGYKSGEEPSDALFEDMAQHYSMTVYHLSCTCRIGEVVDSELHVNGVQSLRVADASVMPNIVSGNINAAVIMIGEKAAEMIARDHGIELANYVGGSNQGASVD